eukprot:TRINITY_DN8529_c0_g3_i2.p1 TRINITY_DN8529_c0_g3~~TRINITY_DN8529_c0_g3_i2.p1  ORF type:complete len:285 (+),score=106.87 TRINITY_DN8529_c0_g3_i2:956-1810(+)
MVTHNISNSKSNKRAGQVTKRKRKVFARSDLSFGADPYCEVKDFFNEISKKNLQNNKGNAKHGASKVLEEETKSEARENCKDSAGPLVVERSSFKEARSFLMIEPKNRRQINSMTICDKEFRRRTDKDSEMIILCMLINGNEGEMLRIQFPYDLSKDSPQIVAREMVNALSLNEEDLERLQYAIEEELKNRETEVIELLNSKIPSHFNKSDDKYDENFSPSDKELHEKVEQILTLVESSAVENEVELDACRTVKELDNTFILEISKLAQRYKTRIEEINNDDNH